MNHLMNQRRITSVRHFNVFVWYASLFDSLISEYCTSINLLYVCTVYYWILLTSRIICFVFLVFKGDNAKDANIEDEDMSEGDDASEGGSDGDDFSARGPAHDRRPCAGRSKRQHPGSRGHSKRAMSGRPRKPPMNRKTSFNSRGKKRSPARGFSGARKSHASNKR